MKSKSNKFLYSALIAGISLLLMTVLAIYAYGYAHSSLIQYDNSIITLNNLINSKSLFLTEIISWVLIIIADLLVTISFYIYLKDINYTISLLGGVLRFLYTIILSIAVYHLINIYQLLDSIQIATSLSNDIMFHLNKFESIWSFGLIIFGFHLFVIGCLAYKSISISKIISILLIIAGISYIIIHFMYGFIPEFNSFTNILENILSLPMMIGEISFAIWLLIKGRKINKVF